MAKSNRRNFLSKGATAAAAVGIVPVVAQAKVPPSGKPEKKVVWAEGKRPDKTPLYSPVVTFGDLVFISGIGAHFPGDIQAHTRHVLDELQARLKEAGSSMERVLKVNVYLSDLKDYAAMNEVYLDKFGPEPPVRTTIAAGGVPGNSLVEIDCIACK
jgi:enamine deaminase RidA (YjgF/YER057c/UK114 family)